MRAIRVNGYVLSQENFVNPDYDHMEDSPTQNFATGNPLYVQPGTTWTWDQANLGMTISSSDAYGHPTPGTIAINSPTYWEFNLVSGNHYFGIASVDISGGEIAPTNGSDAYFFDTSGTYQYPGGYESGVGPTFGDGDVLRMKFDPNTGVLGISKNGAAFIERTVTTDGPFVPCGNAVYEGAERFNYGQQQPFLYAPPDGFSALQTQNLPAADIVDGRDHFQAITGPGQGADSGVPGQLAGNWSKDITIGINENSYCTRVVLQLFLMAVPLPLPVWKPRIRWHQSKVLYLLEPRRWT